MGPEVRGGHDHGTLPPRARTFGRPHRAHLNTYARAVRLTDGRASPPSYARRCGTSRSPSSATVPDPLVHLVSDMVEGILGLSRPRSTSRSTSGPAGDDPLTRAPDHKDGAAHRSESCSARYPRRPEGCASPKSPRERRVMGWEPKVRGSRTVLSRHNRLVPKMVTSMKISSRGPAPAHRLPRGGPLRRGGARVLRGRQPSTTADVRWINRAPECTWSTYGTLGSRRCSRGAAEGVAPLAPRPRWAARSPIPIFDASVNVVGGLGLSSAAADRGARIGSLLVERRRSVQWATPT